MKAICLLHVLNTIFQWLAYKFLELVYLHLSTFIFHKNYSLTRRMNILIYHGVDHCTKVWCLHIDISLIQIFQHSLHLNNLLDGGSGSLISLVVTKSHVC